MISRLLAFALLVSSLGVVGGCGSMSGDLGSMLGGGALDSDTIARGLKEALDVGTRNTVEKTGRKGGYWTDPKLRIPVPDDLEKFAKTLRQIGLGSEVDQFERGMNSAAEEAAQGALPIFGDAILAMTFDDARAILSGRKTAATDYFREKTSGPLRERYAPIVRKHMENVGVAQLYERLLAKYLAIPLVPRPSFSLEEYVCDKGLDGLFSVLATEERKIRENPAARTTELLRKVFAQQGP